MVDGLECTIKRATASPGLPGATHLDGSKSLLSWTACDCTETWTPGARRAPATTVTVSHRTNGT